MNRVVLDASALLAILNQEPGAERMTPELLSAAATSTVNLAEVHGKLVGRGLNADEAWEATLSPIREAVAFTSEHARLTGDLAVQTRAPGVFGARAGFEGAGIHGRQILEEAQS
jgi:ribonuclease VapC